MTEYNIESSGVRWRHANVPTFTAVPIEDFVGRLDNVAQYMGVGMRLSRHILIEDSSKSTIAAAFPITRRNADQWKDRPSSSLTFRQIQTVGVPGVRQLLSDTERVTFLCPTDDTEPRITLIPFADEHSNEIRADFDEMLRQDIEVGRSGSPIIDPDHEDGPGPIVALSVQAFLDPLGKDFIKDMAAARQRRLNP